MSRAKKPGSAPARDRYHHGDLKRALVQAALELLRREGVSGLTLRGVARAAGVSSMAPYHHFADKTALVAAVAETGFDRLRDAMQGGANTARSPAAKLQQTGVAAVVFAVENPELYRVMFSPDLADKTEHPSLAATAQAAFMVVADAVSQCEGRGATEPSQTRTTAVASWAMVHGLATLLIDGQLGEDACDPRQAKQLAVATTDLLFEGLQNQ